MNRYELIKPSSTRKSKETLYDDRNPKVSTSAAPARQDRHIKDAKRSGDRTQQKESNELPYQNPRLERRPTQSTDTRNPNLAQLPPPVDVRDYRNPGEVSQNQWPSDIGARSLASAHTQLRKDEEKLRPRNQRNAQVDLRSQTQQVDKADFGSRRQDNDKWEDSRNYRQRDKEDFGPQRERYDEEFGPRRRDDDDGDPQNRRQGRNEEDLRSQRPHDKREDTRTQRHVDGDEDLQSRHRRRDTTTSQKNLKTSSHDQFLTSRYPNDEEVLEDEEIVVTEPLFKVLTGIARLFVNISYNDFAERAEFVVENNEILNTNLGRFLEEAVWQKGQGRQEMARNCIQSLTLLRIWKEIKLRDVYKHSDRLRERNSREREAYRNLSAQVEETVDTQVAEKAKRASAQPAPAIPKVGPPHQTSTSDSRHAHTNLTKSQGFIPIRTKSGGNFQDNPLPDDIEEDELTRKVMDGISRIANKSPPVPSVSPEKLTGEDAKAYKALSSQYSYKNGRTFFQRGRVFSVLWSQPAGQSHRSKPSNPIDEPTPAENAKLPYNVTNGLHGERIFSQIRRMVVIRNREGYCWCVSIGTYGGRGLKKSGLKQSEIDAHAVVYDSTSEPVYLEGEPKTTKRPIAVDLEPGQTLNTASRLHFAKPFTIEWNTKVMDVGMVARECLISLVADVAEELLGDLRRQRA